MERRTFLKRVAATGAVSALAPAYLQGKEEMQSSNAAANPVPRRRFGTTADSLSIIGFGGIVVKDVTPEEAARYVAEAVDRGVNYFDVAPTYGNAQERLGPALKPYRDQCFLACKTTRRDAAGAQEELDASLKMLQTDHFDLYQLHALTTLDDVEKAFADDGAMKTFLRARDEGKVRHIGFSAHSEEAAMAALDRFEFDSVLFPLGFPTWIKNGFGPAVHERMHQAGKAVLALKAMAHQRWPKDADRRQWNKAWYEPFDEVDEAALGLRFTLHLPVTSMIPPGHWELFKMAVELAQAGALVPLNAEERDLVAKVAKQSDPIFGEPKKAVPPALDFTMQSLAGKEVKLSSYLGKVVMIVNVASKCGLTPQYEQLQGLHEKYAQKGLAILGFPCNQFLGQEPGTALEIQEFCQKNYGVGFDMFAKIEVNGDGACPLYKYLTAQETKPTGPGNISWNFEKFIIGRNGQVVARFAPRVKPDDPEVVRVIEEELKKE